MNTLEHPLPLFAGIGVELEYMIVDAKTLSVLPVADQVLRDEAGGYPTYVERGEMGWSNELALHVIELKTKGPVAALTGLAEKARQDIRQINRLLTPIGGCLMPTAMHPWMIPQQETRLWPHEYSPVYETFNRIFGCQGHGWSNLQSMHLNLPFANDPEFARLHAAIRLVLPILPALAASSPIQESQPSRCLDNRLNVYRNNCSKIPSITGQVIPEPVFNQGDYEDQILGKIYHDVAPFDPEGILQEEWLNARGAIARFDRNTIEIRILDIQEAPKADMAIAAAVIGVIKALVNEQWQDLPSQRSFSTHSLETILLETIASAEAAMINNAAYLAVFGLDGAKECPAGELWQHIAAHVMPPSSGEAQIWNDTLNVILKHGSLARRILRASGQTPSRERLHEIYGELCRCLADGCLFLG